MLGAVHGHTHTRTCKHARTTQDSEREADENLLSTGMLCCGVLISKRCLFSGVSTNVANACLLSVQMVVPQGETSRDATKISVSVIGDV